MSRTIGVMGKLKHTVPPNILKTIYNTLVFPLFNYGILSWGCNCQKLFRLQKKAIRIIAGASYNAHTDVLFKNLELLKVADIYSLQGIKFCYKFHNRLLPQYFLTNLITFHSEIHHYETRGASNFRIPNLKHSFVKNTIRYRIPVIYNNCPLLIKQKFSTHSLQGLTKYTKSYYLNTYNFICHNRECFVCNR